MKSCTTALMTVAALASVSAQEAATQEVATEVEVSRMSGHFACQLEIYQHRAFSLDIRSTLAWLVSVLSTCLLVGDCIHMIS